MNDIRLSIPPEDMRREARDFAVKTQTHPVAHLCLNDMGGLQSFAGRYDGIVIATHDRKQGLQFITDLLTEEHRQVIRDAVQSVQ